MKTWKVAIFYNLSIEDDYYWITAQMLYNCTTLDIFGAKIIIYHNLH